MSSPSVADLLAAFPNTHYHSEARLFTWHPQGLLDDRLADEIVTFIESEAFFEVSPIRCYTDFSQLTEIRLKLGHVFQIAQHRHTSRVPVKSAFFAQSVIGFGIARMYEELMKSAVIEVRAFRERSDAAEWLEVPANFLYPVSGSGSGA